MYVKTSDNKLSFVSEMTFMKKIFIILSLIVIASCTWVGTVEKVQTVYATDTINPNASFYMIYPQNGTGGEYYTQTREEIEESANEAVSVFYNKFHKNFGSLTVTPTHLSLEEGFKQAKLRGDKYLITMEIHEWKDAFYMTCRDDTNSNLSANTAAFDSLDISIRIYDVNTKAILNNQRLQNGGCPVVLLGVIPLGKMGPDSRFDDTLDVWYKALNEK